MTQSRTGWAIAYALPWICRKPSRAAKVRAEGPSAVDGACSSGRRERWWSRFMAYPLLVLSMIGRSGSFSGRAQIWGAIVASILSASTRRVWLRCILVDAERRGTRVFSATGWVVTSAHSGFLNVALELGLVGLALVLFTLVQACRHAMAAFRPGHSGYIDWCIGIVFLTVLYNLDERTLMAPQYLPWILYIVACVGLRKAAFREGLAEVEAQHDRGDAVNGQVVHLLTETDSFSDIHGAALQRWVANILRFEDEPAIVACARADSSWGLDHVRAMSPAGALGLQPNQGAVSTTVEPAPADVAKDIEAGAGRAQAGFGGLGTQPPRLRLCDRARGASSGSEAGGPPAQLVADFISWHDQRSVAGRPF